MHTQIDQNQELKQQIISEIPKEVITNDEEDRKARLMKELEEGWVGEQ